MVGRVHVNIRVFENVTYPELIVIHYSDDEVYSIDEDGMRKLHETVAPRWMNVPDEGTKSWRRIA